MKYYLLILLIALTASCDIQKASVKSKSESDLNEQIETTRKRVGDSVTFIPQFKVIYKDTTVYTVNRQGTTIRTIYDKSGTVSSVDCYASLIDEMIKENRRLLTSDKDKTKEKTETFSSTWVVYVMIGVVLMVALALFLFYQYMRKTFSRPI